MSDQTTTTKTLIKPTADEIAAILGKHRKWVYGQEGGVRADLSGSNLSGSNLSGSNLSGSNLSGETMLPDSVRWREYLAQLLPALFKAGGKQLRDVINAEVFGCHSWTNCPNHAAFDANGLDEVPALYRYEAGL